MGKGGHKIKGKMMKNKCETKAPQAQNGAIEESKCQMKKRKCANMLRHIFFVGFFINGVGNLVLFVVNRVFIIRACSR